MDTKSIINKYLSSNHSLLDLYNAHVNAVANLVIMICEHNKHLNINKQFAVEAALLHDIGICMVDAPRIHCHGFVPYIQHGIMGRIILEDEKLPLHALVCERHIGVGFTRKNVMDQKLLLPIKDMFPVSIEEKVVAYADKFFSKSNIEKNNIENINAVKNEIYAYGEDYLAIFDQWCELFGFKYFYHQ